MEKSESISELIAALAKAQGEFEPVAKSRRNPRFGHAYATLDDIISATRKALSANGLAVMQLTPSEETNSFLETILAHSSGQWLSTRLPIMVGNIMSQAGKEILSQAQAFGSALTYARRYALAALLNVAAEEDDDAETSGGDGKALPQRKIPLTTPQEVPAAPQTPDVTKKGTTQDEKAAAPRGNCPVHGIPFVHRMGITKSGARAGKSYDFWSCPEKLKDGTYCQEKPKEEAKDFDELWEELQLSASQPVAPGRQEAPKTPSAMEESAQGEKEALRASQGQVKPTGPIAEGVEPRELLRDRASQRQINAINTLGYKLGKSLEDIVKELGKAPEELTVAEAGKIITAWDSK